MRSFAEQVGYFSLLREQMGFGHALRYRIAELVRWRMIALKNRGGNRSCAPSNIGSQSCLIEPQR